jgi:uncharacterized membrane protein YraQ (UPF0718 family)
MNQQGWVDRFLIIFESIVFEALPFIVLGALISGVLEELLPQQTFARLIPKRRWLAIAGGALLGLIFPMCECGIVPVMRRLLSKGLPLSCAVAYMLAAPIINPVVIGSTWAAFSNDPGGVGLTSAQMVTLRVSLAFITAFTVGLIVDRRQARVGVDALVKPIIGGRTPRLYGHKLEENNAEVEDCGHDHHHDHCEHEHPHMHEAGEVMTLTGAKQEAVEPAHVHERSGLQRLANITETTLRDFVDISCFLVLGAALASLVQSFRVLDALPQLSTSPFLAAPAMMLLAVILCLCSEADAFVGANLIKIPLAGKLAFLVLGPMLDLKLYLMYTRVFRHKLIWTIIPAVVVLVLVLSLTAHYLSPLVMDFIRQPASSP